MRENACKRYGWHRTSLQNHKQLTQLNIKTHNSSKNRQRANKHFSREDIQMARRHMKRCSTLLITIEMQIKTTLRYHLTPVNTVIVKKSTNKCWRGCGGKGILLHHWWECKLVQPLWRKVWSFLKKLNIELPYHPAIPFLGIYPATKTQHGQK